MSTSDESKADPDLPDDTSKASPIFGALMVLWFSAFSVGALYFAITKYLAGWPLLSMPVLGFGGGGAVTMLIAAGVTAKKVTWSAPTLPKDAPWELRPAWQSPTIREDLYFRAFSPAIAALFVAFSWGIAGVVLYSTWTSGNSYFWVLFGLAFLVGGAAPGIPTLRRLRHRWKYGTSTLVMDTMPGHLGRTLETRLQTSVPPSDAHGDAFHAQLTCYERSPGDDSTSWFQKWQTETDVTDYFASTSQSGATASDRVEVPISFELPDNAPPSTPETPRPKRKAIGSHGFWRCPSR